MSETKLSEAEQFPRSGGMFYACFNSRRADVLAGYKAVRAKFGEAAVKRIKRINKTGLLAMFRIPPTEETKLFAGTIAARVEDGCVRSDAWMFGKPNEEQSP